jgi:hypothetical protein
MVNNYEDFNRKIENCISPVEEKSVCELINSGFDVIWDNTFVKPKHLKSALNLLDQLRYFRGIHIELEVYDFTHEVDVDTCVQRDQNNDRITVGEDIIKNQFDSALSSEDEFYSLVRQFHTEDTGEFMDLHTHDEQSESAVIFDIDGTLAIMGDRGPFDWQSVDRDKPNSIVIEFSRLERNQYNNHIILMSGRDEKARTKTEQWLSYHNIHYDALLMRPNNNFDKDSKVKKHLFDKTVDPYFNVLRAYDDRLSTTHVWYNKGIYVINVNQGGINF